MNNEPTHDIPEELESKLIEAKEWSDNAPSPRILDVEEVREWNARGALILLDVVEIIKNTWDFAPEMTKAGECQ